MTLIPWKCLPQAVITLILGNFITVQNRKSGCLVLWLSLVQAQGWPATPGYGQPWDNAIFPEQNLELSLSDFSLLLHPIISTPHLLKQVVHCDNQTLTSPSGHFTHSDFACLGSPWIWKSLPFLPPVLVSFLPCQTKILCPFPYCQLMISFSPCFQECNFLWCEFHQLPKIQQSLSLPSFSLLLLILLLEKVCLCPQPRLPSKAIPSQLFW